MKLVLPLVALATLPVAALAQTTVLDETFADGQRSTLAPPSSAQWFASSGASTIVYTPDTAIGLNTGSSGRHMIGYFTADGSPVTLAAGESLSLAFTVTFNRATPLSDGANNFRFGLFDSTAGARVAADNQGSGGSGAGLSLFNGYVGYAAMLNLGNGGAGTNSLRERTNTTDLALLSGIAAYTALGNNSSTGAVFTPNSAYSASLTLTRTGADELQLTLGIDGAGIAGYTLTRTDLVAATFAFDTLGFQMGSNTADGFTLSSVVVQHLGAPIPEPSTYAMLAAIAGLGFAVWQRRFHGRTRQG